LRLLVFLLLLLMVFMGVAAYELQRRGLLTRETYDRFVEFRAETQESTTLLVEPVGLAASIQERRQELREETDGLSRLNARIESQRKELEVLIEQRLEELRAGASAARIPGSGHGPESAALSKEMALLVRMYENMPPEQAAAVLDNMPGSTVAQILLQMRGRQAAQVMGALNADKAAEVSKLLTAEDGVKKLAKPATVEAPG